MESNRKVIWSPDAKEDLENITDYLMFQWGIKVTSSFLFQTEKIIGQLTKNPQQYPIFSYQKRIRKCVLTKQNTIYYRLIKEKIEIVRVFDTRQNPKKLKILY